MEKRNNSKRNGLIILAVVCLAFVFGLSGCICSAFSGLTAMDMEMETPPENSFAIINIAGTIQSAPDSPLDTYSYNHSNLINYVDELIEDDGNKGTLLRVNSGGGTVFHSDEMYLKLMEYKEKTGRPIHAYFEQTAASGAYYISCAADDIMANRNCWTGSIGVIISYISMEGLFDKLGVEEIIIATGSNKGMGSSASALTDEQRAIYQSLVDESYETFVEIVAEARDMSVDRVKVLADGRVYTARQALENGLVDSIGLWEDAVRAMEMKTGREGYERVFEGYATIFDYLLYGAAQIKPVSDMEILSNMANSQLSGVPLYMYK